MNANAFNLKKKVDKMQKEDLLNAINKDGSGEDLIVKNISEQVWSFLCDREDDTNDGILMMLIGRLKRETGPETANVLDSWTRQLETTEAA